MADFRKIAGDALALTSEVVTAAAGALRADSVTEPRSDGWSNEFTGIGAINQSRIRETQFIRDRRHTADSLATLFDGDWLAHKVCTIPPKDMFRRGILVDIENDETLSDAIVDRVQTLQVGQAFTKALSFSRAMQQAGIVIGADDGQDFAKPIAVDRVNAVRWLKVYDRRSLKPIEIEEDTKSENFDKPRLFELKTIREGQERRMEIHADRVIWFDDNLVAGPLEGDDCVSVLSRAYDEIRNHGYSWAAVGEMIDQARIGIWKIDGLRGAIGQSGQASIEARFSFANFAKSILKSLVLDKEHEDFEWRELNLTGVPDTMEGLSYLISGACDIPLTRLINRSPAGMNATGESDTRNYHDMVESTRTLDAVPGLERVITLLFREKEGANTQEPNVWKVDFPPLLSPTDSEIRDNELKAATMVVGLTNAGLILEEEGRTIFGPNGAIQSIELDDAAFDDWMENKPEPPQLPPPGEPPPEEGAEGEGTEEPEQ